MGKNDFLFCLFAISLAIALSFGLFQITSQIKFHDGELTFFKSISGEARYINATDFFRFFMFPTKFLSFEEYKFIVFAIPYLLIPCLIYVFSGKKEVALLGFLIPFQITEMHNNAQMLSTLFFLFALLVQNKAKAIGMVLTALTHRFGWGLPLAWLFSRFADLRVSNRIVLGMFILAVFAAMPPIFSSFTFSLTNTVFISFPLLFLALKQAEDKDKAMLVLIFIQVVGATFVYQDCAGNTFPTFDAGQRILSTLDVALLGILAGKGVNLKENKFLVGLMVLGIAIFILGSILFISMPTIKETIPTYLKPNQVSPSDSLPCKVIGLFQ